MPAEALPRGGVKAAILLAAMSALAITTAPRVSRGSAVPVTLSPASANFGNVAIDMSSSAMSFTLANNQSVTLSITSITLSNGDFVESSASCGSSLAAGSSCTITVTFTPSVLGLETSTLTVNDDAPAPYNALSLALCGTGVADVTLGSTSYGFGNVAISTPSNAATVTLYNNESTAVSISSIGFTGANAGDFAQTNTCGSSVAASSTCTIAVTFTPSVLGSEAATLTVSDGAAGAQYQTLSCALSGKGVADVTLTPTSANFSNVAVSTASSVKSFTIQNNELVALNISSLTFTGSNAGDFSQTNACGGSVAASSSCAIAVTFTPSVLGSETATLTMNDTAPAPYNTLSLALSGTGVADVALGSTSYGFGYVAINTPSNAATVTLYNNESTAVSISSIEFTGANAGDFAQTNTCGSSVAASSTCTIAVTFTPSVLGSEAATLTVSDGAAGAQYQGLTCALSGKGAADVALTPGSFSFGNVVPGTPSSATSFTLHNRLLTVLSISGIGFTGANAGDFSQTNTCGISLVASTSCTITVTFTPSVLGAETATLTVSENGPAPYNTLTAALSGTGYGPVVSLSPTSISFGNQAVGTSSAAQTVTLTNSGNGA